MSRGARAALPHLDRSPWPRWRKWLAHMSSCPRPQPRRHSEIEVLVRGPQSACLQAPEPLHRGAPLLRSWQHLNPNRMPSHHFSAVQLWIEPSKQVLQRVPLPPRLGRNVARSRPRSWTRNLLCSCLIGHTQDFPPGTGRDARRAVFVTCKAGRGLGAGCRGQRGPWRN